MSKKELKALNTVKTFFRTTSKYIVSAFAYPANLLRFTKITQRVLVSLLLLSCIPLFLTGILVYNDSSKAITGKVKNYSEIIIKQLDKNINNAVTKAQNDVLEVGLDSLLQENLPNYHQLQPYDKMIFLNDYNSHVVSKTSMNRSIKAIMVIVDPKNVIGFSLGTNAPEEAYWERIQNKSRELGGKFLWELYAEESTNVTNTNGYIICAWKIPYVAAAVKDIGTIAILYSPEYFSDIYKDIDLGEGSDVFIIDSQGRFISCRDHKMIGTEYENRNVVSEIIKNMDENIFSFDAEINGETHLVSYYPINNTDWYTVSIIPYSFINSASREISEKIIRICLIITLCVFVLSGIISLSISMPLSKLVHLIQEAKNGNLSLKVTDKGSDQIGIVITNFNEMIENIRTLISRVKESSDHVMESASKLAVASNQSYTASEQIAVTIQQIAEGASSQAEGVTESVGYMNTLSDEITRVHNNVNEVLKYVDETQKLTENAFNTVQSLNNRANEASMASERIVQDIISLNEDMKEIQKIIKVIVNISDQTNLLSLNAAIEAARAGEAGRGFAVVAGEVRKLADMSKESTITIGKIINSIQTKAESTVNTANNARMAVIDQMEAVKETDESFRTIYKAMEGISEQISKVNNSVTEMVKSREKTQESIEGISAVSEQAAATAEEVSASTQEMMAGSESLSILANELNKMAHDLADLIKAFKLE